MEKGRGAVLRRNGPAAVQRKLLRINERRLRGSPADLRERRTHTHRHSHTHTQITEDLKGGRKTLPEEFVEP